MSPQKKGAVIIIIVLTLGLLNVIDSEIAPFSATIFSRYHLFEKNAVDAKVVTGEDINKYTQIHWADPKEAFEYPERGLTFKFHYEGDRATTTVIDILDAENNKVQSISFPRGEVREIKLINDGLFLHGVEDVSGSWKEVDRDYFYDLKTKDKQPIKSDGQKKCKGKNEEWLLHPIKRSYLLETYCLSTAARFPNTICKQWGVSLITPTKSTNILSFYHTFRQRLRIGWDDENFYVKTRKADVDWVFGKSEQELVQDRLNIDKAEASDQMYIIPLKNLDKI